MYQEYTLMYKLSCHLSSLLSMVIMILIHLTNNNNQLKVVMESRSIYGCLAKKSLIVNICDLSVNKSSVILLYMKIKIENQNVLYFPFYYLCLLRSNKL